MSDQLPAGSECPICIDTLKPPVRILPCGHNFCQTCLEQLSSSSSELKCPTCRQGIQLRSDGIKSLTRNFALENVIESFKEINLDQSSKSISSTVLSEDAISQLRSSATSFINQKRFEEAIQTLQTIFLQTDPVNQILTLFDKVKCYIEINHTNDAVVRGFEILSLIESNIATDEFKSSFEQIETNLKSLIENFIKIKQDVCIVSMMECWFGLVPNFMKDKSLLTKIVNIAMLVENQSKELKNQNKADNIKVFYPLTDEMYKTMKKTDMDDFKFKSIKVNSFLQRYGLICDYAHDWYKSVEIHNQAISALETALGAEAEKCQNLGHCYNNLGVAWQNLKFKDKAKFYYEKSIKVYEKATDYNNEEDRKKHLENAKRSLQLVS